MRASCTLCACVGRGGRPFSACSGPLCGRPAPVGRTGLVLYFFPGGYCRRRGRFARVPYFSLHSLVHHTVARSCRHAVVSANGGDDDGDGTVGRARPQLLCPPALKNAFGFDTALAMLNADVFQPQKDEDATQLFVAHPSTRETPIRCSRCSFFLQDKHIAQSGRAQRRELLPH